jgi:hypothetical protein
MASAEDGLPSLKVMGEDLGLEELKTRMDKKWLDITKGHEVSAAQI